MGGGETTPFVDLRISGGVVEFDVISDDAATAGFGVGFGVYHKLKNDLALTASVRHDIYVWFIEYYNRFGYDERVEVITQLTTLNIGLSYRF